MNIRGMQVDDIAACADILCSVYNNEMWQCRWTAEMGAAYLNDYFEAGKFAGFVVEENESIKDQSSTANGLKAKIISAASPSELSESLLREITLPAIIITIIMQARTADTEKPEKAQ